jgi:hypothetical protein
MTGKYASLAVSVRSGARNAVQEVRGKEEQRRSKEGVRWIASLTLAMTRKARWAVFLAVSVRSGARKAIQEVRGKVEQRRSKEGVRWIASLALAMTGKHASLALAMAAGEGALDCFAGCFARSGARKQFRRCEGRRSKEGIRWIASLAVIARNGVTRQSQWRGSTPRWLSV